jgi:acetolactate decarboxylase
MPELKCTLSTGVWELRQGHSQRAREPLKHIVNKALAAYFDVAHHKIYQVSTATALVEGIYQGAVRVGALREHGDLGLGTFEDLDGEMVIVNGHFLQVKCDGSVREVDDAVLSPFAVITRFAPEPAVTLDQCPDMGRLTSRFDALRHSDNIFFALRVDGQFDYVQTRAMCRTQEGVPLVQAAAVQPEFEFHDITGTLVGFRTPEYARTLNVPGYHLHFVSDDRTRGGHLLQCRGSNLRLQIQRDGEYHIALPEIEDFLKADETAVRLKCNLVHLVWIDGHYDMVGFQEVAKYGRTSGVDFGPVDVVRFAEAFGAKGLTIEAPDQIVPTIKKALATQGPVIVGVPVDYRDNHKFMEIVHPSALN